MELHQTAELIEASLATYQDSHRLNGISELMALADYCIKHNLKTELISKKEHDSFIDPENVHGAWVLRRKGGKRLKVTSESGEVILTLRIEDHIWNGYADHVADWQTFADNSKALLRVSSQKPMS